MNEKRELQAIFKGQVQGVGFRWTVVEHAENCKITGTVHNRPDGTVEIIAQGREASLKQFLDAIQKSPGHAKITSIRTHYRTLTTEYAEFTILHLS